VSHAILITSIGRSIAPIATRRICPPDPVIIYALRELGFANVNWWRWP
jgi:hypothetical protein